MKNINELKQFVMKRPKVVAAYGYGSGVFKQVGYNDKNKPQIDLIFVVKDLKKWHKENMKLNPKDYSFTGKLYFKYASINKLKGNTGITYLSNIKYNGSLYKYGTIEEKDLLRYLDTWESFYLPGRFQKRLLPIIESKNIHDMNIKNREKVLYVALLTMHNDKKQLADVYTQICGLSYLGDTRMKFAENPRKVLNIVEASFDSFNEIYSRYNNYFKINKNNEIKIDYKELEKNINKLPKSLLDYIGYEKVKDLEIVKKKILEYLEKHNKEESSKQTLKGLKTNGLVRSFKYALAKISKKIKH